MKQQEKYLINFPSYEQKHDDSVSIHIKIEHFYSKCKKFYENNYSNDMITITIPDRESIIERFSKCETEDDYRSLLYEIKDVSSDIQYSKNINTTYSFIRLIVKFHHVIPSQKQYLETYLVKS